MLAKVLFVPSARLMGINVRLLSTKLTDDPLVLTKEVNDKGLLILNRPSALNAATFEMIENITDTLIKWKDTKSLIIVRGNGGKAFCAGGDVKEIAESAEVGTRFAKIEYSMSHMIRNFKIPYVALIDGITMGGGVGIVKNIVILFDLKIKIY